VGGNATVFLAEPEKALLDLIHLTPRGDTIAFLEKLRLENTEIIDGRRILGLAERTGSARLMRAAQNVAR
jgi:hypothetical protein